jgi:hypothetical protein
MVLFPMYVLAHMSLAPRRVGRCGDSVNSILAIISGALLVNAQRAGGTANLVLIA